MSSHLRFTPDDHDAICHACRTIPLVGPYAAFQRALSAALHLSHPALAKRISGFGKSRVRTLRVHLEIRSASPNRPHSRDTVASNCDLSVREWQAVSQACALMWLSDDCPRSFQGRLVGEVEETEPALAEKLGRLDAGQAATLYHRVKTGKRWCA